MTLRIIRSFLVKSIVTFIYQMNKFAIMYTIKTTLRIALQSGLGKHFLPEPYRLILIANILMYGVLE